MTTHTTNLIPTATDLPRGKPVGFSRGKIYNNKR